MARRIESHLLDGPAGKLEALLEEPAEGEPREAVLVCHPHPLYGGTMHNKVVYRLARGLRRSGSVVLRFNFRGVGRSEGSHAHGAGEVEDARAALSWLLARYPALPVSLAGFSFGSRVVLKLGCEIGVPRRILALGFPTALGGAEYLYKCVSPKYFIQSTHDEHGPREKLLALFERFAEPKRLIWVEARDHFFAGALDQLEEEIFRLEPLHVAPGGH
ncbi:MAG TPA: alpha/beta fold hydrolase [Bryobacteraceae bacterium]|nr:alpha/beta fold hydrolase [Bryobacteraceae bacterium]